MKQSHRRKSVDRSIRGGLILLVACGALGCRNTKPLKQSTPEAGSSSRGGPRATAGSLPYTIDGKMNDWSPRQRILAEAGGEEPKFEDAINVRQVFLTADRENLYVFFQTQPSVAERYEVRPTTGGIAELYFDIDNNRGTGCQDTQLGISRERYSGFETALDTQIFVGMKMTDGQAKGTFRCVNIPEKWKEGEKSFEIVDDFDPWEISDQIAEGADGVEFYVPLSQLGIAPGAKVRVLVVESSNAWDEIGYKEVVVDLPDP